MISDPHGEIGILLTAPMARVAQALSGARFRLHCLWEAADQSQLLEKVGPSIRGIAAGGHTAVDEKLTSLFPALEIIANFGVGYDRIDVGHAAKRGYVVTNTPGVLDEEVADLTLGLLLCTVRSLPQAERFAREGRWLSGNFPLSSSLQQRKVGILGLGRIGKAIAKRLDAFGVTTAYHGRIQQPDVPRRYYSSLIEMAGQVDVLIVCAPGGRETENIVNAAVLEALGPNGILINVARGSLVDERALIDALKNRTILAAGLDVFAREPQVPPELLALENAVLLPHVGSASHLTRNAMGQLVADNLIAWFEGRGPITPVPETPYPRPPASL
jgi:lactate dehydrogenase-like 2-hydroxyacid dehydrogenase